MSNAPLSATHSWWEIFSILVASLGIYACQGTLESQHGFLFHSFSGLLYGMLGTNRIPILFQAASFLFCLCLLLFVIDVHWSKLLRQRITWLLCAAMVGWMGVGGLPVLRRIKAERRTTRCRLSLYHCYSPLLPLLSSKMIWPGVQLALLCYFSPLFVF